MKPEYSGNKKFGVPRSKRNLLKLLGYTIILILLIEIGRITLGSWVTKQVVAQWGVIEKGCWVEALFLHDEIVIKSEVEGGLSQKVENGSRVSRGTVVACVNTGPGLAIGPDNRILRLERRLTALLSEDEALNLELKRVNNGIKSRRRNLNKASLNASEIKEDLGSLEKEKQQILRNIKSGRENILRTRVAVKDGMRGFKSIVASKAGYIYFQYDNWEGKLSPDRFFELSEAEFRNNYRLKSAGNRVKIGATLGKIISPFDQLVAVMVDTEITGRPAVGDFWRFKSNDCTHSVIIKNIIPLSNRKVILAFEDTGIFQQYIPNRRVKIFATYKKVGGVSIPTQALYKNKGRTFVKLQKGDGYSLQEVQVLETDGDRAVIEGIDFGTTIMSR